MNSIPFIHLFETKNNNYVFDVNSNEIIQINEIVFDYLHLLISGMNENEIKNILSNHYALNEIEQVHRGVCENITNNIYFSSNRPKKISMFCCSESMKDHYDRYINQMTFEVTERCNLRCRYCVFSGNYEDHRTHGSRDMNWDTMKKGLDYMLKHGGQAPNPFIGYYVNDFKNKTDAAFSIGFYGGEPLLNLVLIKKAIEYVEEYKPEDKKIHFTITTNGTLLTKDIVKYFIKHNVGIVLSLDGPKHIHDRARLYPDGRGSYEDSFLALESIVDAAKELHLSRPYHASISVVLTGDYSYMDLVNYFCTLEPLMNTPYVKFNFNFTLMSGGIEKWNEIYADDSIEPITGYDELEKEYEEACLNGEFLCENDPPWRLRVLDNLVFLNFFFKVHGRNRNQFSDEFIIPEMSHPGAICIIGARRPYMKVDGTLLPCERVPSDDPYYVIGDCDQGINVERCEKIIHDYTQATYQDCQSCWIHRMCGVSCFKDCVQDGCINAELKQKLCQKARKTRHEEIISMLELLEKNPRALEHFDKYLTV